MNRLLAALTMLCLICAVSGCGEGSSRTVTVKEILSDEAVDGYVARDPVSGSLTLTQVVQTLQGSVLAGSDPVTLVENRAFLDFPLQNVVPGSATIDSATLEITVRSIEPRNGSIPLRIELVSFEPPLVTTDFDRSFLQPLDAITLTPPIDDADVDRTLLIDVTPLMRTAQSLGLADFQVRLLEDPGASFLGLVEIDDRTSDTAPLLRVRYF